MVSLLDLAKLTLNNSNAGPTTVSEAFEKQAPIGPRNQTSVLSTHFTPTRVAFTVINLLKFSDEIFLSL